VPDNLNRRAFLVGGAAVAAGAFTWVAAAAPGKPKPPHPHKTPTPSPTTTSPEPTEPVPTITRTRTLEPPSDEWPGSSNTGVPVGTSLTPVTGNFTTTSNGQIVDALDVTDGAIVVEHSNVTVKRCRVSSNSFVAVYVNGSGTLLIEDCELECQNNSSSGWGGPSSTTAVTARRLNVHSVENGANIVSGADIRDCWFHDFNPTGADPHTDGLECSFGVSDVNIIHNNFDMFDNGPTSAVIQFETDNDSNVNWLVENNRLIMHPVDGAVNVRLPNVDASANNLRVVNNRLTSGIFGYVTPNPPDTITEWSGNVDDVTGVPVP
jgi:hypothetical protein